MKVALIHYRDSAAAGGSVRVGEILANYLAGEGVHVNLVFAYGASGPLSQHTCVDCRYIGSRGPKDIHGWKRSIELFQEIRPDVIHFVDLVHWLALATTALPSRRIFHVHGLLPRKIDSSVVDVLMKRCFRVVSDANVCINHELMKEMTRLGYCSPKKTRVVYNSIEVSRYQDLPEKKSARASLGLPLSACILGMVCRVVHYKGCQDAVHLLRYLPDDFHLMICGDGPYLPVVQALAEQCGCAERVHFVGMLEDVTAAYGAMDAFLHLSRYEAFGLSIGEAMAARLPVFGLMGEGGYRAPERPLVTPENSHILPRANITDWNAPESSETLKSLASALKRYWSCPSSFKKMTTEAFGWVNERFNPKTQARDMADVYRSMVESTSRF